MEREASSENIFTNICKSSLAKFWIHSPLAASKSWIAANRRSLLIPLEFIDTKGGNERRRTIDRKESEIAASADQTNIQSLSASASAEEESWRWDQNGRFLSGDQNGRRTKTGRCRSAFTPIWLWRAGRSLTSFSSFTAYRET